MAVVIRSTATWRFQVLCRALQLDHSAGELNNDLELNKDLEMNNDLDDYFH